MDQDLIDAVEYLTAHPDEILEAWNLPHINRGGVLFDFVSPAGESLWNGKPCGCLTTIRLGVHEAATPELTAAIRADERIPESTHDITVAHLPVFAEWQQGCRDTFAKMANL